MYHPIEDQERNPQSYVLTQMDPSVTEDECHDLLLKPRQTQRTIGLYLKKVPGNHGLEREVKRNKGFWVDKPQNWAHLVYKLRDKYTVDIPKKETKGQGVFCRPKYMELDYHIKLANAGLLYSDEEISDSENEEEPDTTACMPLRKIKYKKCDPCKPKKVEKEPEVEQPPKDLVEEVMRKGEKPKFKKIPSGCQCDYYGEHGTHPSVWDNPFDDRMDMLRQHEMNKYMRPYKCEILNKYYEENPPMQFQPRDPGAKRTFPIYLSSNL
ncbi:hypothetical protein RUM44_010266 [Polyplax serrata]|uniref:Uncharacterized protein n=1 Tax=Polyplax serrata TaxID=468196 RepID=A0ABR1AV22_POLSC